MKKRLAMAARPGQVSACSRATDAGYEAHLPGGTWRWLSSFWGSGRTPRRQSLFPAAKFKRNTFLKSVTLPTAMEQSELG